MSAKLRPVRFKFANDDRKVCYKGWTDDTYWNGALNVVTTPAVVKRIEAQNRRDGLDPEDVRLGRKSETMSINGHKRRVVDLGRGLITQECPKRRR